MKGGNKQTHHVKGRRSLFATTARHTPGSPGKLRSGPTAHDSGIIADMNRQMLRLRDALRKPHLDSVLALVAAVEAKDVYTQYHSLHVAVFAEEIARAADMRAEEVELIRIAAILHDVGKIGIPDAILSKPGPLTPEELSVMRRHPSIGVTILQNLDSVEAALPLILHHHENFDGSGYPGGLAGGEIPLGARAIRIADSLDAMTSPRVYKNALPLAVAVREIEAGRNRQFDPDLADVTLSWLRRTGNPRARLAQSASPLSWPVRSTKIST